MGGAKPPAATLVGVQSLASDEWLVEIEVTAVIH
jgi:enamine deaminase RidA (YjgF/YER057c/UK114 family)